MRAALALAICLVLAVAFGQAATKPVPNDPAALAEMLISMQSSKPSEELQYILQTLINKEKAKLERLENELNTECEPKRRQELRASVKYLIESSDKLDVQARVLGSEIDRYDTLLRVRNQKMQKERQTINEKKQLIKLTKNKLKSNAVSRNGDIMKEFENTLAAIELIKKTISNNGLDSQNQGQGGLKSLMELSSKTSELSQEAHALVQAAIALAPKADEASIKDVIQLLDEVKSRILREKAAKEAELDITKRKLDVELDIARRELKLSKATFNEYQKEAMQYETEKSQALEQQRSLISRFTINQKKIKMETEQLSSVIKTCAESEKIKRDQVNTIKEKIAKLNQVIGLVREKFSKMSSGLEKAIESATVGATAPVNFEYSAWSKCSLTCGEGTQSRSYRCVNMVNETVEDERCVNTGLKPYAVRLCMVKPCPVDCLMSDSVSWGSCPATCKMSPAAVVLKSGNKDTIRPEAYGGKACPNPEVTKPCKGLPLCTRSNKFKGYYFSATRGELLELDSPRVLSTKSYTFSAWFKPRALQYGLIWAKEQCNVAQNQLRLELHADGHLAFITDNVQARKPQSTSPHSPDPNGWEPEMVSFNTVRPDQWFHTMVVRKYVRKNSVDGVDQYVYSLFLNGRLQKRMSVDAVPHINQRPMSLGGRLCNGQIDRKNQFFGSVINAKFWYGVAFGKKDAVVLADNRPIA